MTLSANFHINRANCSRTTGERLASKVASWGLEMLAICRALGGELSGGLRNGVGSCDGGGGIGGLNYLVEESGGGGISGCGLIKGVTSGTSVKFKMKSRPSGQELMFHHISFYESHT